MSRFEAVSRSVEDTRLLARSIAACLPEGGAVALTGEMASGKTTLAGFLAREFGFTGRTSSPTYTILNRYVTPDGRRIVHADFTRLQGFEDLEQCGFHDEADGAFAVIAEWADLIPGAFEPALTVRLEENSDGSRSLSATATDEAVRARLRESFIEHSCV